MEKHVDSHRGHQSLVFAAAAEFKVPAHHGEVLASLVMGPKAKQIINKKRSKPLLGGGGNTAIEKIAENLLKDRIKERKTVNVPWFYKAIQRELLKLDAVGHSFMCRGKVVKCGWSWAWRYLIKQGCVSRRRTCKRPFTSEQISSVMKKWCHALREEILRPLNKELVGAPAAAVAPPGNPSDEEDYEEWIKPSAPKNQKTNTIAPTKKTMAAAAQRVRPSDYGEYKMKNRFHTDQSPFCLDGAHYKTYVNPKGQDCALVSGQPGAEKRFGTLQITMHGDPNSVQPPLGYCLSQPFGCV